MGSIFLYLLRPILYLLRFTRNFEDLKYEVRDGEEKMDEVPEYIYDVRRGNYNAESGVEMWIQNLEKKLDEAKIILAECYRYYYASTPNIISRYRLSKKAEKAAQEIAKCLDSDEAYSLFRVVDRPSSTKMVADILKVLDDEEVNTIGLYGITSSRMEILVGRLEQLAISGQLFERIVRFGMSWNYDLLEIQGELAAKIGLQLKRNVIENAVIENARLINERLTKNKILVIFDGVHEYFNLHAIGIPGGGYCKVVLTSRDERMCIAMGTQININMQELVSELWLTFKDETKEWWQENEGEDSIAKELVQDCEALTRQMQEKLKKLPSEHLTYDMGRSTESEIQENESPTKKTHTELLREVEVEVEGILHGINENKKIMCHLAREVKWRCSRKKLK